MSEEQAITLQEAQQRTLASRNDAPMSLTTGAGFDQLQRVAKALCASTLVPVQYRAFVERKEYGQVVGHDPNPAGLPNCIVALNMAQRMNADPLLVMQNLHIIEGRPSWSSPFIIAAINHCGRFSPLRFELGEPGEPQEITYDSTEWVKPAGGGKKQRRDITKKATIQHRTCRAWVIEKETGDRLDGPTVSIQMAIDEGWLTKNGSKWLTMPEVMLRYRAASLFGRLYAPELLMGLQSQEEAEDIAASQAREVTGQRVREVDLEQLQTGEPQPPAILDQDDEPEPEEEQPRQQAKKSNRKPDPDPEAEKNDGTDVDESHHNDNTYATTSEGAENAGPDDSFSGLNME